MSGIPIDVPPRDTPTRNTNSATHGSGDTLLINNNTNNNNQKNSQKNKEKEQQKNEQYISKEQKNKTTENISNQQGQSSGTSKASSSTAKKFNKPPISIITSKTILEQSLSHKRKLVQTPITPSLVTTAPRNTALSDEQKRLIHSFKEQKHQFSCVGCTNTSCISITEIKEGEIIFTCTICKSEVSEPMIQTQILKLQNQKKSKKDNSTATPNNDDVVMINHPQISTLPGTNEHLVSAADKLLVANYNQTRHLLVCTSCNTPGNINKNGHNKATPPRPIFKCKCGRTWTIDNIREFIDIYNNPSNNAATITAISDAQPQQLIVQQQQDHSVQQQQDIIEIPEEDDMMDDSPLPTIPPHTPTQAPATTPSFVWPKASSSSTNSSLQLSMLFDTVNELKAQVSKHDEQFTYINSILEENKKLQKENLLQKKEIEYLKKIIIEQKKEKNNNNTEKNNIYSKENQKNNTMGEGNDMETNDTNLEHSSLLISQPSNSSQQQANPYDSYDESFPAHTPPPPQHNQHQPPSNPENPASSSYAKKAASPPKPKARYRKYPGQTYRFNEPTKEELEIASKAFDDTILTNPPNYTFVHFPCNRRL